jgi:hypothetical protein
MGLKWELKCYNGFDMNVCQGFAKRHLVHAFYVGGILVDQFVVVDFGLC